jgi:hypothetical protein
MKNEIELTGLDGANPLGYLAALGTLRALSMAWPDKKVRMRWVANGAWQPVLVANIEFDGEELVRVLYATLSKMSNHPAVSRWDNLNKIALADYRSYLQEAVADASLLDRRWVDFAAAFGCDIASEEGFIQDTAFRTMSGAGHQDFLVFIRALIDQTLPEHLSESLFGPWRYADERPSLRLDPADDRRYALRWDDPSSAPIRTVRGANRLAIEGLPLFPCIPSKGHMQTTGFRGNKSRDTYWTWPIWEPDVTVDVVRSILSLKELQNGEVNRNRLATPGIVEIYRAQRITVGKFRNFTAGQPV